MKHMSSLWCFSGEQKTEQPWSVFLESRKQRRAGVIFSRSRKFAAAIFCCGRTARFVCRLGEIFINLFFDLRLDLPIILFTIFG